MDYCPWCPCTGQFGKVFKVENKFDHRTFALKQIKIHPKEDLDKVLKEVENLSKVKTKNVNMILSIAFFNWIRAFVIC